MMGGSKVTTHKKLSFSSDPGFHKTLKARVKQVLADNGTSRFGGWHMLFKTACVATWFCASYFMLVFVASSWWEACLYAISLALSLAGIGFCIQHDANHGSYSRSKRINSILGFSMDWLGASSYMWRFKHNIAHHTFTNVVEQDDDINAGFFGRLAPTQTRYRMHRFQHFYMWFFYSLLAFLIMGNDIRNLILGHIAGRPHPRPRGRDAVILVVGKMTFAAWALVVPMLLHTWWVALLYFVGTYLLFGLVLGVVFQLAHCVEGVEFPDPSPMRPLESFAAHQVRTTNNFAQNNRFLTWYLGGLNHQVEHHLFPKISHVHYPLIAPVVEQTCKEYGLPYHQIRSFTGACASHYRFLRELGKPVSDVSMAPIKTTLPAA